MIGRMLTSEGDRLLAEAELHRATAKKLPAEAAAMPAARSDTARAAAGSRGYFDPALEDDTMRMLRDVEASPRR